MPARKARAWAPLAAEWLTRNLAPDQIRRALTDGIGSARSALGLLRWRLEHGLPDAAAPPPAPRVTALRECAGSHVQPRLFRPAADEDRCPTCRTTAPAGPSAPPGPGLRAFRAARAASRAPAPTT